MESATECLPAKNYRVEFKEMAWTVGLSKCRGCNRSGCPVRFPLDVTLEQFCLPVLCRLQMANPGREHRFASVSAKRLKCNFVAAFSFGLSKHCFSLVPLAEMSP